MRAPGLPDPLRRAADDRGQDAGRPDSDLRHDQHDRRRGRAVSDTTTRTASGSDPGRRRATRRPPCPPTASGRPEHSRGPSRRSPRRRRSVEGRSSTASRWRPKPGDNMIEAAKPVGADIPYYCYHPRLSIAANCRMCLVEASDAPGRWCPAARPRVKEGLEIITTTADGEGEPARGDGVPAAQPPGGLRHLRPGRRVQAAGLLHAVRPPALAPRGRRS